MEGWSRLHTVTHEESGDVTGLGYPFDLLIFSKSG